MEVNQSPMPSSIKLKVEMEEDSKDSKSYTHVVLLFWKVKWEKSSEDLMLDFQGIES